MYADYSYYTGEYGGSLIPEADWNYTSGKAGDQIDSMTFGRLREGVPESFVAQVRRCCCELAELIYTAVVLPVRAGAESGTGQLISTETNSTYSVTYRNASVISAMNSGESSGVEQMMNEVIGKHLSSTGLLYKGVV